MLSAEAKAQLRSEIIFLTHNAQLHEVNMQWHPKAEDYLWTPQTQEVKRSEGGMMNLRYRAAWKRQWLARFQDLLAQACPIAACATPSSLASHGPLNVELDPGPTRPARRAREVSSGSSCRTSPLSGVG